MSDLDQYLRPVGAPASQSQGAVSAYQFGNENERNSVTLPKIKNLNFSVATGGTLTLGGSGNGLGQLIIKDSVGNIIISFGNTGGTVYNGNLIVLNDAGGTVIDNTGVNSITSFNSSSDTSMVAGTTTSATYTPISGGTLTSLVLSRSTKVFTYMDVLGYNNTLLQEADFALFDSFTGTTLTSIAVPGIPTTQVAYGTAAGTITSVTYTITPQEVFNGKINTMAAGTHNISIKVKSSSGSAIWTYFEIGFIQLGV